jgi:hypothetical protein
LKIAREELPARVVTAGNATAAMLSEMTNETIRSATAIYRLSAPQLLLMRLRRYTEPLAFTQPAAGDETCRLSLVVDRASAGVIIHSLLGRHGSAVNQIGGYELAALREMARLLLAEYALKLDVASRRTFAVSPIATTVERMVPILLPEGRCLCLESRLARRSAKPEILLLAALAQEATDPGFREAQPTRLRIPRRPARS